MTPMDFMIILLGLGAVTAALGVGLLIGDRRGYNRRDAEYVEAARFSEEAERDSLRGRQYADDLGLPGTLPAGEWPQWGPDPAPRGFFSRAFRIRLQRPGWLSYDVCGVGAAVDAGLLGLAPQPIPPTVEVWRDAQPDETPGQLTPQLVNGPRFVARVPVSATVPNWPWTLPLEPGLGDYHEDEPVSPAPAGPRHAAVEIADPLTDSGVWFGLVAQLSDMGVDVDPLALPCSFCETETHDDCPGCACPCRTLVGAT